MWPPDALEFLRELEANNDRDWFRAHRARYDAFLLEPALALAEKLRHLGEPRTFRPYNDTRFRPRPPLKEHLGVAIGYGGAGGYYFELSLDGLILAAGLYRPAPDQLERYRAAIDHDGRAEQFEQAVAAATAGGLAPADPTLKRAPRGYPANHPRIGRLRMKELIARRRHPLEPWLHGPACDKRVQRELESAQPLVHWLAENVGTSRPHPPG
jgi:uncharacterized protein (TIGR02453 family)